ncbi:hypothetical protein [Clostridium botulinum]|uniref:hypothetical protein n=1 Tax=Clostridium botulinum TaxID=1491 RepID=UPI001E4C4135|nr:hypothetical protein [Clostridium botulinum]MCD3232424.1 hypothetical protein [Clostridium botulinum C/D]
MCKYKKLFNLGAKIEKAMKLIESLDYGSYSLKGVTGQQKEILHILENLLIWQNHINKRVCILYDGEEILYLRNLNDREEKILKILDSF